MERWVDIDGFEGVYQISSYGRVKSFTWGKEKILKNSIDSKGYVQIAIGTKDIRKPYLIHRLVASAFIPNPESKREVNHIDLNKQNNNVDNLEWMTRSENIRHSVDNGHHYIPIGDQHASSKITTEMARIIKIEIAKGCQPLAISKNLNVPYNVVKDIKRGRTWKQVEV